MRLVGTLVSVERAQAGSSVTEDYPAGASVVQIANLVDFLSDDSDAPTGLCLVGDIEASVEYEYTLDAEAVTLTLEPPLVDPVDEGDPVIVLPARFSTEAKVQLPGDGEPITALVAHGLTASDWFRENDYGPDEGPTVELERRGGVYLITDLPGRDMVVDGSAIDPETLPPSSDGIPPAESPTPRVVGGDGVAFIRLPLVDNADPTQVRVYASTVSPVDPVEANLAGVTNNGGTLAIRELNDQPLVAGTVVHVATVAFDADGDGPLSAAGSGEVSPGFDPGEIFPIEETDIADGAISTPKLQANAVTAEKVSSDVIVANDVFARDGVHIADGSGAGIDITAAGGFQQSDSAGASRVSFPSRPDEPNVIDADLTTRGLTALGRASFRGLDNEISRDSRFVLATGTTPPTTSVSVQPVWEATGLVVPDGARGLFRGTGVWHMAQTRAGFAPRMVTVTDAGVVSYQALPLPIGTGYGIVKVGARWYAVAGPSILEIQVYVLDSAFQLVDSWALPITTLVSSVATDGARLFIGGRDAGTPAVQQYSTGGVLQDTVTLAGAASSVSSLSVGAHDFGQPRIVAQLAFDNRVRVYDLSGTEQVGEAFSQDVTSDLGWDGSRFYVAALGQIRRASKNKTTRTLRAAYTWYDSDPAGDGTHETTVSQIVTVTQPARSGLRFTTPPPADDGSVDAPDSARLYLGHTDSTLRRQGSPFVVSTTILDPDPDNGDAPPASNSFPEGNAGRIQSSSGTTFIAGDGSAAIPVLENRVLNEAATDATAKTEAAKLYADSAAAEIIKNVPTPSAPDHAANKAYVDEHAGASKDTGDITLEPIAPFTGPMRVRRIGNIVITSGSIGRPSGYSTASTNAMHLPYGFRPSAAVFPAASAAFGSSTVYQMSVPVGGYVQLRMTGAFSGGMPVSGIAWVTSDDFPE